jgi:CBS domain containing-hemolysin-like protein
MEPIKQVLNLAPLRQIKGRGSLNVVFCLLSAQMLLTWIAIGLCIIQTGIFSGLNLALFSVSRLRLEVEAAGGDTDAAELYALRADSNFALTTIIWGNVATNVVLTLLSESALAGLGAFLFSTILRASSLLSNLAAERGGHNAQARSSSRLISSLTISIMSMGGRVQMASAAFSAPAG